MKLSTRGRYGARALMELARTFGQGPLSLKEIASRQAISLKYLEQIAMLLKDAEIVTSVRGPAGGYKLSRAPNELNLLEIVEALEGSLSFVQCVEDQEVCERTDSCAFTDLWRKVSEEAAKTLRSVTLADMVKRDEQKKVSFLQCMKEEPDKEPSRA